MIAISTFRNSLGILTYHAVWITVLFSSGFDYPVTKHVISSIDIDMPNESLPWVCYSVCSMKMSQPPFATSRTSTVSFPVPKDGIAICNIYIKSFWTMPFCLQWAAM